MEQIAALEAAEAAKQQRLKDKKRKDRLSDLKQELHKRLLESLNLAALETATEANLKSEIAAIASEALEEMSVALNKEDRTVLNQELYDEVMGLGPIPAVKILMERTGLTASDFDVVESNEAFAAQACAVNKDLGWNPDIVNVNGGAIAIGHPIGASGTRVLNTLIHEMIRRDAKKGLATLCIGGGMGVAMCFERP